MENKDIKVAVAYCHVCKEKIPIQDQIMKKGDKEVHIVSCAVCETVLNVDKDIEVDYVGPDWLKDHGWEIQGEVNL